MTQMIYHILAKKKEVGLSLVLTLATIMLMPVLIAKNAFFYSFLYKFFEHDPLLISESVVYEKTQEIVLFLNTRVLLDESFFSQQAIRHMHDVKILLDICTIVGLCFLSLFILNMTRAIEKKDLVSLAKTCMYAAGEIVAFVCAGIPIILFTWDSAFTIFHEVFFFNDDWLFSANDSLIVLFPNEMFISSSALLVTFYTIVAIFLFLIGFITLQRTRSYL